MSHTPQMRVGLGHDTHRLVPGRELKLGGVLIEFDCGLEGHSDADVLLHAITDALLGAAGLDDIGESFPPRDPKWKDADSAVFLTRSLDAVRKSGWEVCNLDCTVFAEEPKLSGDRDRIRTRLAGLLGTDRNAVNVKAKTGEGVGPIGRGEAISADAVVLLMRVE